MELTKRFESRSPYFNSAEPFTLFYYFACIMVGGNTAEIYTFPPWFGREKGYLDALVQ